MEIYIGFTDADTAVVNWKLFLVKQFALLPSITYINLLDLNCVYTMYHMWQLQVENEYFSIFFIELLSYWYALTLLAKNRWTFSR